MLVVVGSLAIQVYQAGAGGPVTEECAAEGIEPQFRGSLGVCHIVEGIRSRAQSVVWVLGMVLGGVSIAAGFTSYRRRPNRRQREQCIAGAVLGAQAVVLGALLFLWRTGKVGLFVKNFLNLDILDGAMPGFIRGVKNTLTLAFVGEFGGIVIGLVLSVLAISTRRTVRAPARIYINFFRGTPLIWQLAFFYYFFVFGVGTRIAPFTVALLVFAWNTGAYAAEVFRAGIQSIERGQIEAARSLGMTYLQAMRYAVIPQAFRRVIPPLMNEFVILIKDTALIIALSLSAAELDIYNFAREIYSATGNATAFTAAAAAYLVITLPLIGLVNRVERRLRSGLTGVVGAGI